MKKIIIVSSLLLSTVALTAQDKIPSFGKVDKADLLMKDCDFDTDAEALILFDIGESEFRYVENTGWISETNYRMRIKVLKSKGVDRAAIKLSYFSKNKREDVSGVSGVSFNLDANGQIEESKLEGKNIYNKAINKDYSEISFALPNVRNGTVFEYRYKTTRKTYSYIPSWNFQQSIPVRYSAFNLVIPEFFQFTTLVTKRQELEKKTSNGVQEGTWYIMRNIPGLKDEPFSSGRIDYLQRMDFQLSGINSPTYIEDFRTTWPKIIDELQNDEDFGLALKKNLRGIDEIVATAKTKQDNKERIRAVYKYVQRNMQWNDEYGIYSDNGIKEAWDKKNGNITDINFILINILKEVGIKARPMLVSTKDHGAVNPIYPFLKRFNAVLAYVKDGDTEYIMNAADKFNPYNLVPYDVINTNALVVDKAVQTLITLDGADKFTNNIFFACTVEPDGKLAGQATLNSAGYARNIRMSTFKKSKLKEMVEDNTGITIRGDSITVKNEEDELLPFEQKIEFSGSMQSGGDYFFLPYNLFTGLGKNPFIEENRVMDIDFNFPKNYVVMGTYFLPDNFVVNELPKNTKMIMPDTSIVLIRKIQIDGNIISFKATLDFLYPDFTVAGYPLIKDFFKKMYAILDERIVLRKK